MILPGTPVPISATAAFLKSSYPEVQKVTGVQFGKDFLWHVHNPEESDWFPNSEKPSIALSIFKEDFPLLQLEFAADLQYALHYEGRDLCDNQSYVHLLEKYSIDESSFFKKLSDRKYKELAEYDFSITKHLNVTGYPTLFLQTSESTFHLLTRGYSDYYLIENRLNNIIKESQAIV
jgi:putative protein-disulfide isomerase